MASNALHTVEEVKRMLANARGADQAFFWLAAETGLRAGELIALRVAEVDLKSHSNRVKTKLDTRTR
jgi:integrase